MWHSSKITLVVLYRKTQAEWLCWQFFLKYSDECPLNVKYSSRPQGLKNKWELVSSSRTCKLLGISREQDQLRCFLFIQLLKQWELDQGLINENGEETSVSKNGSHVWIQIQALYLLGPAPPAFVLICLYFSEFIPFILPFYPLLCSQGHLLNTGKSNNILFIHFVSLGSHVGFLLWVGLVFFPFSCFHFWTINLYTLHTELTDGHIIGESGASSLNIWV